MLNDWSVFGDAGDSGELGGIVREIDRTEYEQARHDDQQRQCARPATIG